MTNQQYNGYTNYETWVTSLWIDTDQKLNEGLIAICAVAKLAEDPKSFLADSLKELIEESYLSTEMDGVLKDLLKSAIENINWIEIANMYLDE